MVDLALRWLWDKPEVSVVLSGMSNLEHVKRNIEISDDSGIHTLSQKDLEVIAYLKAKYLQAKPIPCTKCRYCMPCPNSVDIPRNLELYNEGVIYDKMGISKVNYNYHMPDSHKASSCTGFAVCEAKCPQRIGISAWMPKIQDALKGV